MANGSNAPTAYINARLIDPATGYDGRGGLLVGGDGRIADFGANLFTDGAPWGIDTIDCRGRCLAPGIVDLRVHTGEPGEEHKETFDTAGRAAAAGGVTSMVVLPDTEPPFDDASLVEFVNRRARQVKLANMYAYGALTVGLAGQQLAEVGLMQEAGAVAFTDADRPIANAQVMRRALYYAKGFDALIVHLPQEPSLSGGVMNSGELATRLGLPSCHPLAETIMVERDIRLAEMTGGRIHLSKISTAESADVIRRAKKRGIMVTCDTAPQYFALNEIEVGAYRTFAKLVPPLRSENDRRAIAEAVCDGTIDCIVSDHRPQDVESKRLPFTQALPGAVGLETLLPVSLELMHNGGITLPRLFERLALAPSRLFRLPGGRFEKGAPADLVVFDPDMAWKIEPDEFRSKTGNSPFDGKPTQGRVLGTVVAGRMIHRDEKRWPLPAVAAA